MQRFLTILLTIAGIILLITTPSHSWWSSFQLRARRQSS